MNRKIIPILITVMLLFGFYSLLYAQCGTSYSSETYWSLNDAAHAGRWEAANPVAYGGTVCATTPGINAQPKYWIDGHMHWRSGALSKSMADAHFSYGISINLRRAAVFIEQSSWTSSRSYISTDNRLIPFIYMKDSSEMTPANVQTLYNQGIKGIKLHNRIFLRDKGYCIEFLESPRTHLFYAKCESLNLPILTHGMTYLQDSERPATLRFTPQDLINQMIRICKAHPKLNYICTHMADMAESKLDSVLDLAPNLMIDGTSYTKLNKFYHFTCAWQDSLRKVYQRHNTQFIWGTDFDFDNTQGFVAGTTECEHFFLELDLDQTSLENIAHANMERICGVAEYPVSINNPNSGATLPFSGLMDMSTPVISGAKISFTVSLGKAGDLNFKVMDVSGSLVSSYCLRNMHVGLQNVGIPLIDANKITNGVYFVSLEQYGMKISQKFTVIR